MALKQKISKVVVSHINNCYGNNIEYANKILAAVKYLLHSNIKDYTFPEYIHLDDLFHEDKEDDILNALAKVNEKESRRKKEGVYYTDSDVTDFLTANTMLNYILSDNDKIYGVIKAKNKLKRIKNIDKIKLIHASIFDPTCGTGEFLLSALYLKITLLKNINSVKYEDLAKTVYGNDIELQSTDITKLRLFFLLVDSYNGELAVDNVASYINANFTNVDAVVYDRKTFGKKDIIIGNPPYVEYRNFDNTPQFNYGNIYADVLHHSVDILTDNGVMAFVIPLSYVSTIRMSKIRNYISNNTDRQIVLNFADRPDSLFSCVHQKLTIIIAQKESTFKGVLSSSYNYWYQSERNNLFDNIKVSLTDSDNFEYWPKIGNLIEKSLYNKFKTMTGFQLLSLNNKGETADLYINQRGCFWMKAFTHDMHSNSYTKYSVAKELVPFIFCLINSSLFFLLWVIISDGWHITNKELNFVKIPSNIGDSQKWVKLMNQLETKLEQTKLYVGTKQVEYEYKHKECKTIIDEIDDELSKVFNVKLSQLHYIKNFALKYRLGNGT